jgi:hypothetical protein
MASPLLSPLLSGNCSPSISDGNEVTAVTYQSVLGALLVDYWTTKDNAGVGLGSGTFTSGTIDTWTGQIRGLVLQAPAAGQRPVYAADGGDFAGKSVVQCAETGTKCLVQLTPQTPDIFVAGTRPWIGLIGRLRTSPTTIGVMFQVIDSPATNSFPGILYIGANQLTSRTGGSQATAADSSTAVRLIEGSLDSNGVNILEVNGTQVATNGTGLTQANAGRLLSLGVSGANSFPVNLSAAQIFLCSARPSTTQRAALLTLARSAGEWNW